MRLRSLLLTCVALVPLVASAGAAPPKVVHRARHPAPTAAYKWLELLLEASGREVDRNNPRPTILSRTMAIVLTAMYDAWAAYDARAVGTRLGGKLRRPEAERTQKNKETAIAYAAYRALLFVYAEDKEWLAQQMKKQGFDPNDETTDLGKPAGVGNVAAAALIAWRRHDGANQLGDEPGASGKPYADYTYYRPRNSPEQVVDGLTWLPITFTDAKGKQFTPGFLTPHWYRVKPFALTSADQFRAPPPPQFGSEQLKQEVEEAIKVNAELTLQQKATVEFMRDGPRSTGQSGHWLQFAQDLSRRDRYDLDKDVKLFFAIGNIVFDAFIACWETKRFYDTGRPYWWARLLKKGQKVQGWLGPGKGTGPINGEQWLPYSPQNFITPPFPGYVSGHATASGAAAKVLELFSGSDEFNGVETRKAGAMTEEKFTAAQIQAIDGKPSKDTSLEVTLPLPTWSSTAEMAAMSRLWGGYHIRTDNNEGLVMGRKVAAFSWPIYQSYFDGTAKEPVCSSDCAQVK